MDREDAIKKLEESGIDADVIKALSGGGSDENEIALLKAKLADAEGKASGILGDKKKYQAKVEEMQARLEELEGKDLGEVEKLQREIERRDSQIKKLAEEREKIETDWKAEQRNAALSKIGSKFKWLDSVPEKTRELIINNEFADIEDLGNEVMVGDRLKNLSESYSGLLASDAPSGAGSKAGSPSGGSPSLESLRNKPLSEIASDPESYLKAAIEAQQGE